MKKLYIQPDFEVIKFAPDEAFMRVSLVDDAESPLPEAGEDSGSYPPGEYDPGEDW